MDGLVAVIVALISGVLGGGAGGFLTARAQNRRTVAESEKLLAEARQLDADSLRDTVTTLMSRLTQQDAKIAALSERVLELEEEREALYEGIGVLVGQLESNRICPEWRPTRKPKTR